MGNHQRGRVAPRSARSVSAKGAPLIFFLFVLSDESYRLAGLGGAGPSSIPSPLENNARGGNPSTSILTTNGGTSPPCKGNPLCFRLPPAFRFHFRSRSHHLISLPQRLRSNDILRHPLPTPFRSRSHDVAWCRETRRPDPTSLPTRLPSMTRWHDTYAVPYTYFLISDLSLIWYIHYFVY